MIIKRQKLFLVFLIILQILFVKVAISQSDSAYVVSGKINGLNNDIWVWLQNNEDNQQSIDSIKTKNGEFGFIGTLAKPSLHLLKIGKSSKESFPFFIENTKIDINCDYKFPFGCEVKGSYNQHLIDEFAIREKLAWNQEVIESLKNTYINYSEKAGFIRKQRFSDTIKSFALLPTNDRAMAYLASINSNYILDEDLASIYENFGTNLKASEYAQEIKAELNLRAATKIGRKLVDIKQNDLNGEKVSLWDFREKYVLLYFWASGFEPCRTENLKFKKIYSKYKDWNFDVMAVSLDSVESDWNRAVMEDNLNWHNVSDLKGWDNAIAKKLNIQTVPYTLLLDREGIIIGKDLRAEELDNILNLIKATSDVANPAGIHISKKQKNWNPFRKKTKNNAGALPGAGN